MKLTPGGSIPMGYRLRTIRFAWYLEIPTQAFDSKLHDDETGWRVNGTTRWLWCVTATDLNCFRSIGVEAARLVSVPAVMIR